MIFLHITILFMQKIKRKAEIFNQKDKIVNLSRKTSSRNYAMETRMEIIE